MWFHTVKGISNHFKIIMQRLGKVTIFVIGVLGLFGFYDQFSFFSPSLTTSEGEKLYPIISDKHPRAFIDVDPDNLYQCELAVTDPWDPTILDWVSNPPPTCEPTFQNLTYISNGFVAVNGHLAREGTTCQWQCLYPGKGGAYTKGSWENIDSKPTCDTMKVRCFTENNENQTYYENLHVQIIPKPIKPSSAEFNIHIFVVDSVSRSQGLRFLPETIKYLEKNLEAYHFPYYTKNGHNSPPNGYSAFIGKHPDRDTMPPTISKPLCDNQTFKDHYIGNILQANGFATLFNEDYFSIFPNEKDFKPTHTITPLPAELELFPLYNKTWLFDERCQTSLDFMTEFFTKFVQTYGNKPKFSLNWNTWLSHDELDHLKVADTSFVEFFKKNSEELDKSFFIFMGDHGPNYGLYRYEEVIAREEMNPMFYISLPKALRSNKTLRKNLKLNSQKLVSHFDLYATLIDMATMMDLDIPENLTLHGQSFFKQIPDDRDCGSMGISPMYCNCRYRRRDLPKDDPLRQKILKTIFTKANETIWPHRNVCNVPTYHDGYIPIIEQIFVPGTTKKLQVYYVMFETLPGPARWWTYVYVLFKNDGTIKVQNFVGFGHRLTPYWPLKRCFTEKMDFCFCKRW